MRWPFRRKADTTSAGPATGTEPTAGAGTPGYADGPSVGTGGPAGGDIAQPAGVGRSGGPAGGGQVAQPAGSGVVRPPARQWATLPAIPVTIPRTVPLIIGPAPVVPPLRLGGRRGLATSVEAPVGTVTGLARSVVRAAAPVVPAAADEVGLVPPPMVRRPARTAPAEVVPLVDAVDEYVGEPRVPAEPYRAPGWLRFMPDWAKSSQPEAPVLPSPGGTPELVIAEPPSFLPAELRSPPAVEPPPRMEESVRTTAEDTSPPLRRRRPNLGQSRRLGLGAPISTPELIHEPPPIVDGTVESPQEPPPPPAAPARVVEEPEPEPVGREAQEPPRREEQTPPPPGESPATPPTGTPPPGAVPAGTQPAGTTPAKPVAAVYRATAELRPAPRRPERPRATVVDRVPAALASEVRTRQQADVSEVPVYRGPKVGEAARSRGARAFAAGGAVFLPDEAGPVDSPRTRGLLAHELVHAVQQRTLGPHLPAPDSPLGQRLEAEAQAAERFYAGESGAAEPPPLIHAPLPAPAPAAEPDLTVAAQLATELTAAPAPTRQPQPDNSPFDEQETAEVGRIATESARHVVSEWTHPALQQRNQQQGSTSSTHAAAHGAAPGPTTHGSRREQLIAAELVRRNSVLAAGAAPLTQLPPDALSTIDRQIATGEGHGSSHGSHSVARHNQPAEPAEPRYEAGSGEAWMHAITGMNLLSDPAPTRHGGKAPGLTDGWFDGKVRDDRPFHERLADRMGLIDPTTATQFDTDTWWEPEVQEDAAGDPDDADSEGSGGSTLDLNNVDLDELAARLYDRLRSRLRLELLVDRERAGMLTDFR
jgi:hypothetical protein